MWGFSLFSFSRSGVAAITLIMFFKIAAFVDSEMRQREREGGGNPTNNSGMQNGSSVGIYTQCIHVFAHFAPICTLCRALINKISPSELSRKFIKSALLVGKGEREVFLGVVILGTFRNGVPPPPLPSFPFLPLFPTLSAAETLPKKSSWGGGGGGGGEMGMTAVLPIMVVVLEKSEFVQYLCPLSLSSKNVCVSCSTFGHPPPLKKKGESSDQS